MCTHLFMKFFRLSILYTNTARHNAAIHTRTILGLSTLWGLFICQRQFTKVAWHYVRLNNKLVWHIIIMMRHGFFFLGGPGCPPEIFGKMSTVRMLSCKLSMISYIQFSKQSYLFTKSTRIFLLWLCCRETMLPTGHLRNQIYKLRVQEDTEMLGTLLNDFRLSLQWFINFPK